MENHSSFNLLPTSTVGLKCSPWRRWAPSGLLPLRVDYAGGWAVSLPVQGKWLHGAVCSLNQVHMGSETEQHLGCLATALWSPLAAHYAGCLWL